MTKNPLFEGNKFYFSFEEYKLFISQTITFTAFIINEENGTFNNKLLGKNIFELSSLGDFTEDLNTPIMRKIELYQNEDKKYTVGKITVQFRLLFDEEENEKEEKEKEEKEENEKEEIEQEEIEKEEIEQEENEK